MSSIENFMTRALGFFWGACAWCGFFILVSWVTGDIHVCK